MSLRGGHAGALRQVPNPCATMGAEPRPSPGREAGKIYDSCRVHRQGGVRAVRARWGHAGAPPRRRADSPHAEGIRAAPGASRAASARDIEVGALRTPVAEHVRGRSEPLDFDRGDPKRARRSGEEAGLHPDGARVRLCVLWGGSRRRRVGGCGTTERRGDVLAHLKGAPRRAPSGRERHRPRSGRRHLAGCARDLAQARAHRRHRRAGVGGGCRKQERHMAQRTAHRIG